MSHNTKMIQGSDYWSFFGRRLTDIVDLTEGAKVLDMGTGSGACLIPAARKIGPKGHIVGIDLWTNVIKVANENIKVNAITNAHTEIMDARKLTYNDNSFDYVLSGFIGFGGIYDFQNNRYRTDNDIMRHVLRVLKPQGTAGFSSWSRQEDLDCLRELTQEYLSKYRSSPQMKLKHVSTSYGKETIQGLKRLMADIGFNDIEVASEDYIMRYDSVDDWISMMKTNSSILSRFLGPGEEKFTKFKEAMLPHGIESYRRRDGYYFRKEVIFATGKK